MMRLMYMCLVLFAYWLRQTPVQAQYLWHTTGNYAGSNHIAVSSDGSFWVAGYAVMNKQKEATAALLKCDAKGQFLWSEQYPLLVNTDIAELSSSTQFVLEDPLNKELLLGINRSINVNAQIATLLKTDKKGKELWRRNYQYREDACSVVKDGLQNSKGFLFVGETAPNCNEYSDLYVVQTNPVGDVIWEKSYGKITKYEAAVAVVPATDQGYVLGVRGGDVMAVKISETGTEIWNVLSPFEDNAKIIVKDIMVTSDGGYMITGYQMITQDKSNGFLLKINSIGKQEWLRIYNVGYDTQFSTLGLAPYDQIWVGGSVNYIEKMPQKMAYIALVDRTGTIVWEEAHSVGDTEDSFANTIVSTPDGFWMSGTATATSSKKKISEMIVLKQNFAPAEACQPTSILGKLPRIAYLYQPELNVNDLADCGLLNYEANVGVGNSITLCPDFCLAVGYKIVQATSKYKNKVEITDKTCITYTPSVQNKGEDILELTACHGPHCKTVHVQLHLGAAAKPCPKQEFAACVSLNQSVLLTPDFCLGVGYKIYKMESQANATCLLENQNISYTPPKGFVGDDRLAIVACQQAICDTAFFNITVTAKGCDAMQVRAKDDYFEIRQTRAASLPVLQNDNEGLSKKGLAIVAFSLPAHGLLQYKKGSFEYEPDKNFKGIDLFTYRVCNPENYCTTAQVTINVAQEYCDKNTYTCAKTGVAKEICPVYCRFANNNEVLIESMTTLYGCTLKNTGNNKCLSYTSNENFVGEEIITIVGCLHGICDTSYVHVKVAPADCPNQYITTPQPAPSAISEADANVMASSESLPYQPIANFGKGNQLRLLKVSINETHSALDLLWATNEPKLQAVIYDENSRITLSQTLIAASQGAKNRNNIDISFLPEGSYTLFLQGTQSAISAQFDK